MFPNILERDTRIIDWASVVSGWCTTFQDAIAITPKVRSNGVLNDEYATCTVKAATGVIPAGNITCAGLHMKAPQSGAEFTPYQVSVSVYCEDLNVRPFLFVGRSPTTLTADATGDSVGIWRIIGIPNHSGPNGSALDKEITIVANPPAADQGLCFYVGLIAGVTISTNLAAAMHMSVRRLIGPGPRVIDVRKL